MAAHAPSALRARRAALLRGIYVILNEGEQVVERGASVLDAGVRILQYRAKGGVNATHLRALRRLTRARDALLILNDDWPAATAFDCDGVHLGPLDAGFDAVASVRDSMPHGLIGLSCGTSEEVRRANSESTDYLGVGSVYATISKPDAGAPIGVDGLCRLARLSHAPVAAIGGIDGERLREIRATGVAMAAVIGAVESARDPAAAARDLVARWSLAP